MHVLRDQDFDHKVPPPATSAVRRSVAALARARQETDIIDITVTFVTGKRPLAALPSPPPPRENRWRGETNGQETTAEIENRYKHWTYTVPERTGVSYMVAPVQRTWMLSDGQVHTGPMPHLMFYAPNITNEQIGAE